MSHLFKTGNSIYKVGDTVYKVNDRLNVIIENKGGFGSGMELLRVDPVAENQRVAVTSGGTCKIINTNTYAVIASVNLGNACVGVTWDSPNGKLYITSGDKLYSVNTTTWTATNTGLTSNPYYGIALDPNPLNNRLIISGGPKLYFIDKTSYTINQIMMSGFSNGYGITFHPDNNNQLYLCNYNYNYISIIDTDNYVAIDTITGFNSPIDIAFDPNPSNNRFLVCEYAGHLIAYVNKKTHGVIRRVSIVSKPDGISFDPNYFNNRYFIASSSAGEYSVVNEF